MFSDDLIFHTLELPKFDPSGDNVNELPALEKWLYFLQRAEYLEADELAEQLVDDEFREAAGVLEMISESPEDRYYYEARMKFLRDEATRIEAAEEDAKAALERGLEQGELIGQIRLLQGLLDEKVMEREELLMHDSDELTNLIAELQQRLRSR